MKTIIAGSRHIKDAAIVCKAVELSKFEITEVVSGGAPGVDTAGEAIAETMGLPLKVFPAKWEIHGRAAGPIRNQQMAEYADALIAVWDGKSKGTKDMIDRASEQGLAVFVYVTNH